MTTDRRSKVIGYFAYLSPEQVVCTGDACVVSGSESSMQNYLKELNPNRTAKPTIRKTRFGEILDGIGLGGAYAFDAEAYTRFYPLAREEGLDVVDAEFESAKKSGDRFFILRALQ